MNELERPSLSELERLRRRQEARDRRRRRRRLTGAALAALAVALAAAITVAVGGGARRANGVGPARASTTVARLLPAGASHGGASAAAGPTGADSFSGGAPARPTSAELAAVGRLAAHGLPLFCGGPSKPLVALTFDDGPGPYTRLALRKLRAFHARATFFLVGKEIRTWPGLAARERPLAAFGDHTMTHPFLPALPAAQMLGEIADARTLIEQATGEPIGLFRPPYEGRNAEVDSAVRSLGLLDVLWSVDSADSLGANYLGIEHNVIAGLRNGAIILMHENRGQTIRALPVILAALQHRHLQAVTVPELVAEDPPSAAQLQAGGRGCGVKLRPGSGG